MNGVSVPDQYRHMVRAERRPEFTEAVIRDYIKKHDGELIKLSDLNAAAETTTATQMVQRLLKTGRITRHKLGGGRGKRYTYKWHDIVTKPIPIPKIDGAGVMVRSLDLPVPLIDQKTIDNITKAFHIWIETETDGQCIVNVVKFRKYLQEEHDKVKKKREEILDAHNDNSSNNSSAHIH